MTDDDTTHDTDRILPLFDHTHDPVTTGAIVGFAAILGYLAAWLAADFGVRTAAFLVAALGSGYLLYGQTDRRAVLAAGCYSLAALVALIPVSYELGVVVTVDDPMQHVLATSDLLFLFVFWLLAGIIGLVAYRISTGAFWPRIRTRLPRRGGL